mgnify:CR=1 FL=1
MSVDLFGQYHVLATRTVIKTPTYDCDTTGTPPPVGYPCDGKITAAGTLLMIGATVAFNF